MILENDLRLISSFTDGTSFNRNRLPGEKMSIHAQVPRESTLDWFYELISRFPAKDRRELKACELVPIFLQAGTWDRYQLQKSLRRIRIHITDPAPYLKTATKPLKRYLDRLDAGELDPRIGVAIRNTIRRNAAFRMVYDSPMARFQRIHKWYRLSRGSVLFDSDFDEPEPIDLTPFEINRRLFPIENLARGISESEAVFAEPLAAFQKDENGCFDLSALPVGLPFQLLKGLSESHAFDKGDSLMIRWIGGERDKAINLVKNPGLWFLQPTPRKLFEVDSAERIEVQAADVACGIVRRYLAFSDGIMRLAEMFDFIQMNGVQLKEIVNRKSQLLLTGSDSQ